MATKTFQCTLCGNMVEAGNSIAATYTERGCDHEYRVIPVIKFDRTHMADPSTAAEIVADGEIVGTLFVDKRGYNVNVINQNIVYGIDNKSDVMPTIIELVLTEREQKRKRPVQDLGNLMGLFQFADTITH